MFDLEIQSSFDMLYFMTCKKHLRNIMNTKLVKIYINLVVFFSKFQCINGHNSYVFYKCVKSSRI